MGASGAWASAASSASPDFIPASYDELAGHYYEYITGMVRKAGIPDQDVPDAVQSILERLEKKDILAQYDPEHLTEHQGKLVKTRFSTFLGAHVLLRSRGERGKVQRRARREVQVLDAVYDTQDAGGISGLLARMAASDDYSGLDAEDLIAGMRGRLAAVPPRSARDTCDLVALFDEIVAEVTALGEFTYAGIQARFGISSTTANMWLSRLRTVLGGALGRPVARIGGVALTAPEIAAAAVILREAAGVMVAGPLARAGHPLAEAAKGWYHPFAQAEIRKFPGIQVPAGTHAKPGGHVKEAVIHRLERIAAEADITGAAVPGDGSPGAASPVQIPVPRLAPDDAPAAGEPADDEPAAGQPDPEATPEEEFEAFAWHYLTDAADMDQLKALAQRAYADSVS